MRTIAFKIEEKNNNHQIRDFLKAFGVSSSLLTQLKNTENGILLNGNFARTIDRISTDDTLTINIVEKVKSPKASKLPLEVLYEDDDLIAVNKPPFMPVHESLNHRGDTLSNAVANYLNESIGFRAIYRLDRDTSGIVLIAKNSLSASKLAGKIKKDYYAICIGNITEAGVVNIGISRENDSMIKRVADTKGETAITQYFPVSTNNTNTLVKFNLLTGRTHQIRVHMSYINHPLLGDDMYGGNSELIDRQALHCKDIYFTHPITNKEIHITTNYPEDFKKVM